ncbi:hypothetical protein F1559_002266 [Cyanidiococcus yangmingshanensis]|uniref:TsaA-like domain-containing protein n=1 Tax=Cyanidiococcus yangmingshanensis TaxID=2690220 RepID=A0A7J7ID98_9RHOD|nr:hypothetical protein F1559_002266 [Cyanidiococcus yangmingshanensis]
MLVQMLYQGHPVCSDARAPYAAASLASKYQEPTPSVQLTVIGMASTPYRKRREAPRQPNLGDKQQATLYISADMIGCNSALGKIQPGDWLWIVSYFDRNQGLWRAFIRPPRYRGRGRLGVFATRSPHRPNAVGLSLVQVIETRSKSERQTGDMELCIQGCDLLHHTPILSVEPYQPETQNWPGARVGWLQEDAALTTAHLG